jgi:hypothetical protein
MTRLNLDREFVRIETASGAMPGAMRRSKLA